MNVKNQKTVREKKTITIDWACRIQPTARPEQCESDQPVLCRTILICERVVLYLSFPDRILQTPNQSHRVSVLLNQRRTLLI